MAAVTIEGGPGEEDSSSRPMVDANGPVEKEEEAGEEKEEAPQQQQQQQQQASPPPPPPPDCEEEEPPGDDDTTTEHKGEMDVSGGGEGNGGHGATQEEEEEAGEKKPSPPAVKDMVPLKPDIKKEEDGGGEQQPPGAATSPGGPGPPGPGRGGWPSGGTEPPVEEEGGDGGCSQEQRAVEESGSSSPPPPGGDCCTKSTEKPQHGAGGGGVAGGGGGGGGGGGTKRRASVEISSSDGEPLSRMDSEDSISSTLMDMESTASSGRSTPAMMTPAMMNGGGSGGLVSGPGSTTGSVTGGSKALVGYTCCWDNCLLLFPSSPDLAEHIRSMHVDGQRGGVFVCLWKGCKVYNTPSTSQSWLQRHMLSHSGDKPFKCVVGGCNATFASQGGLARHVPTHFSSQSSSKMASQGKVKEESPSKAGLNKRRKLKNKRRRSLPRPHDFFDAQTMDAIRHRAICLNLATQIEGLGNGHSVVFHSTVIARRKEDSGKVKVLLHWTPEDIMPDVWVNESDRPQQKTKVVHLSKLPTDTAVLLDPNIYRMFF